MSNWQNRIVGHGEEDPKSLVPNPSNVREHDDYQRKVMNGFIDEVGWIQSVIKNVRTGRLIDGHMRVEEAIKNGEKSVPVTYVDVSEEDEKRILLLFDPIGALAKQNSDKISDIVSTVALKNASTGDYAREIARKNGIDTKKYKDADDKKQEKKSNFEVKEGDLFSITNHEKGIVHRIICGNNTLEATWSRLLAGKIPTICITSPPYNQKINTFKPSGMQKENTAFVDRMADSYEDDLPEDEYQAKQIEMVNFICSHLSKNGSLFYNHKIRYREKQVVHPISWLLKCNHSVRQEIIWDRGGSITLNARMLMPIDERIYWIKVGDDFTFNDETEIKSWSTIWRFAAKNEVKVSAAFPVELPYRCILMSSVIGDLVIDPYVGSGTTIVAADRTGRIGYGIEISPTHMASALQRFTDEGMVVKKVSK